MAKVRLTAEDFDFSEWMEVSGSGAPPVFWDYSRLYASRAAEEPRSSGRQVAYQFLSDLCSLVLDENDPKFPFGPLVSTVEGTSAQLNDFSSADVAALAKHLARISDCALRARIADVDWIVNRATESVEVALAAYLSAAKSSHDAGKALEDLNFIKYIIRAARLARQTGKLAQVQSQLRSFFSHYLEHDEHSYTLLNLIGAMLIAKIPENEVLADCAEERAVRLEARGSWMLARSYWSLLQEIGSALKDDALVGKARLSLAETHVKEAEMASSCIVAAHHIEQGISAFRKIPGQTQRLGQLHKQLLQYQENFLSEMILIEEKIDGKELFHRAVRAVAEADTLNDAFLNLGKLLHFDLPREGVCQKIAEEHMKRFLFSNFMPGVKSSRTGKTLARESTGESNDGQRLREKTYEKGAMAFDFVAQATIAPAAAEIYDRFRPSLVEVLELIEHSLFIPESRSLVYAKGILCGLEGDFDTAAHLLIPQIENSLRHLMSAAGHLSSRLDDDLIQDEYLLHHLLYRSEMHDVVGPDNVFRIRTLFTERFGLNFRNNLAHGLVDLGVYPSHSAISTWGLAVYLVFFPAVSMQLCKKVEEASHEFDLCGFDKFNKRIVIRDGGTFIELTYDNAESWVLAAWNAYRKSFSECPVVIVTGTFHYVGRALVKIEPTDIQVSY